MEDLITAKKILQRYNAMSFRDFVKEFEVFTNQKVTENIIEDWKFLGLNNADFIFCNFLENYGLKGIWEEPVEECE